MKLLTSHFSLLTCSLLVCGAVSAAELKLTQDDAASTVTIATAEGKPILTYQMKAGEVPPGTSPVFKHGAHLHPVYSPSGKLVTGNHPEDHPHQRGIWIGWTKTEFGDSHPDFWNQGKAEKKGEPDKVRAEVRFDKLGKTWSGENNAGFISEHRFIDHGTGAEVDVLREVWEVSVSQQQLGDRMVNVIDLTSTQTCAGNTPLKLPKYHYGGLGVRGNQLWNAVPDVTMLTSEGHDRLKGDATKAKWVHMGGQVDGAPTGIVTLIHPSNFRFPQPLRLNPKNPQLCVAPSADGDWAIEPGKPYVSKYRMLIVDGAADAAWIERQWQAYAMADGAKATTSQKPPVDEFNDAPKSRPLIAKPAGEGK